MKHKILNIIAAAAAVLVAAACNKPAEEENLIGKITIAIQPDELAIGEEGGPLSFSFTAPDYWFASSPEKWINIEPYSGKPGSSTVTFTVSKNTVAQARSAVITVNAKGQRGQIKLTQSAWPYTDGWSVVGNIGGSNWDTDFYLEDLGDGLMWKTERLPFHSGEAFKFRMGGSDAVSMGMDGGFSPMDGGENAYWAKLSQGGGNISLPTDGYWDIVLDLNDWNFSAVLVDRFPWTIVGTLAGGSWDADTAMEDKGDKLVWGVTEVPYHFGEEFKFRMDGNDAYSLGLDGEVSVIPGDGTAYEGKLKQGGDNITLPAEGYWNLTLDVESKTMTAIFVREFTIDPPTVPAGWAPLWVNDDTNHFASWDGYYRIAGEGFGTGEEVCTIPADQWEKMKTKPFYVLLYGGSPQIRVTTGWWSTNLTGNNDIQPGSDLLTDNGNGYWTLKLDLSTAPDLVAAMDAQHLLLTGGDFTVFGLYYSKDEWKDAGFETVLIPVWENDGSHGPASWDGVYRYGLDGRDGNNECIATFPQETWDRIKSETFYVKVSGENPQIRVTTGWWSITWTGQDIQPGNELLTRNEDGTWTLAVDLTSDQSLVDLLDEQHLLFTGGGFAVEGIYFEETVPVVGDDGTMVIWENDGSHGNINWSSEYRFAPESNSTGEEIYTVPQEEWERMKSETFYVLLQGPDPQIRVTTGWWSATWKGNDIFPGNELLTDNEDGTYILEVNLTGDPILDVLDVEHLLFTGGGYTPLRLYLKD